MNFKGEHCWKKVLCFITEVKLVIALHHRSLTIQSALHKIVVETVFITTGLVHEVLSLLYETNSLYFLLQ